MMLVSIIPLVCAYDDVYSVAFINKSFYIYLFLNVCVFKNTYSMPGLPVCAVRIICKTAEPTTTKRKKPKRIGPTLLPSSRFYTL